jgi:hypothetical protein
MSDAQAGREPNEIRVRSVKALLAGEGDVPWERRVHLAIRFLLKIAKFDDDEVLRTWDRLVPESSNESLIADYFKKTGSAVAEMTPERWLLFANYCAAHLCVLSSERRLRTAPYAPDLFVPEPPRLNNRRMTAEQMFAAFIETTGGAEPFLSWMCAEVFRMAYCRALTDLAEERVVI